MLSSSHSFPSNLLVRQYNDSVKGCQGPSYNAVLHNGMGDMEVIHIDGGEAVVYCYCESCGGSFRAKKRNARYCNSCKRYIKKMQNKTNVAREKERNEYSKAQAQRVLEEP